MFQTSKPKIVKDIQGPNGHVFGKLNKRVNLSYKKRIRIPLTSSLKAVVFAGLVWAMFLGTVAAPTFETQAATIEQEREALQQQLRDLEAQIDQYEGQITAYRRQGNTLSSEIGSLNSKISKINLQIRAIQLTLADLNNRIGDTEVRINVIANDISSNKQTLAQLLRNLNSTEDVSMVEVFLRSQNFSDFMGDVNGLTEMQDNMRQTIRKISDLKAQLENQKEQLVLARADAATVKIAQEAQRQQVESVKTEKNQLLAATKGQEARYQQLVSQKKAEAAKIRARIFQLLGGGSMTFEQAYNYAKYASQATGVRPALILAILDRESALGRNVGQCTYHTAMSPTRDVPAFLRITKSLGINPEAQKVSCPNADGVYGGAMGPAQFIPSTWEAYAARISALTGRNPANPWNNSDAFIASGLYLRDAGASSNERVAAAKYYCGGNWNRYVCLNVYGRAVVDRAAQFERDIAVLNDALTRR